MIPSSVRSAPETNLDDTGSEQLESSQSPATPLMNVNTNPESSSSPATVPTIPNAVLLINPSSSQQTGSVNAENSTSGPSSITGAAFSHARK